MFIIICTIVLEEYIKERNSLVRNLTTPNLLNKIRKAKLSDDDIDISKVSFISQIIFHYHHGSTNVHSPLSNLPACHVGFLFFLQFIISS